MSLIPVEESCLPLGGVESWYFAKKHPQYLMPHQPPRRFWLDHRLTGRPASEAARLTDIVRAIDNDEELFQGDFIDYMRLRGLADLFFFSKYLCAHNWLTTDLHGPLAWAWQAPNGWRTPDGQVYDRYRLAVLARSHLKTTQLTQDSALFDAIRDTEERILIYTHSLGFTQEVMSPIKSLLEGEGKGAELFQLCYGHLIPEANERGRKYKWDQLNLTLKREGRYTDPTIKGGAVGAKITGTHSTKQYVDDLVGEQLSRTLMDKTINGLENLTYCYHSLALGERRVVGTPWGFWDPISYSKRHWPESLVARLPWRRPNGELMFDKCDVVEALRIKKQNPWFFSCTPPGTKILMSDWTYKNIEEIVVGESVVGWKQVGKRKQFVPSLVVANGNRIAAIQRVTLKSGSVVRCTPDHRWVNGYRALSVKRAGSPEYQPAQIRKPLARLVDLPIPVPDTLKNDCAWLGGMYDGEGSISQRPSGCLTISQSPTANPGLCEELKETLARTGFDCNWNGHSNAFVIRGGRRGIHKFLLECKPRRKKRIIERLYAGRKNIVLFSDPVTEITSLGDSVVYSMQTETGNYIADGYGSANCQYDVWPKDEGKNGFQSDWFRTFTRVDDYLIRQDADGKPGKRVRLDDCNVFVIIDPNTGRVPGQKVTVDANAPTSRALDYAGFLTVAIDRERNYYILSAIRRRCNSAELIDLTFQLVSIWRPKKVVIEQRAAQILFVDLFRVAWRNGKPPFIIDDFPGGHASKEERIKGLIPLYANGLVHHREGGGVEVQAGMAALEGELLDFPNAEYDDLSDAASVMLKKCYAPGDTAPAVEGVKRDERFEVSIAALDQASRRSARAWQKRKYPTSDEFFIEG